MRKRRDAGSGGIEHTRAGTYKVVLDVGQDPNGKRQRYRKTFKTLKAAQTAARDALTKRDRAINVKPERITTGEWARGWLKRHHTEGHIVGNTYARYELSLRLHIIPALGSVMLQDLRRDHVLTMKSDSLAGRERRPEAVACVREEESRLAAPGTRRRREE